RYFGAFPFVGDQSLVRDEEHAGIERRLVNAVLLKRERDRALRARQSLGDAAKRTELLDRAHLRLDVVFGESESFAKRLDLRFLHRAEAVVSQKVPDHAGVELAFD